MSKQHNQHDQQGQSSTLKGMEGKAFQQMLNWMEKKGLLLYFKVFCCNQDSSVLHQLNTDPQTAHVQVVHNPGHTKKNFVKDLKKAFGGGQQYEQLC